MVILRAPEPGDLDRLYIWENSSDARRVSFQGSPVSRHQLWEYLQGYDGNLFASGELRFMIVDSDSGETVGTVDLSGASSRDLHAEVGIFIAQEHRNKHFACQALDALAEIVSQNFGIHSLFAVVDINNTPSIRLFPAAGFRTCGKLRSWVRNGTKFADAVIFQRLI